MYSFSIILILNLRIKPHHEKQLIFHTKRSKPFERHEEQEPYIIA